MKKKVNSRKKLELNNNRKMKILEKNPQKGGIPAIEKRAKSKIFVKVLELPKLLNEYKVLKSKLIN